MVSQFAPSGLASPMPVPFHAVRKASPCEELSESVSPSQPPTRLRPTMVSGISAARMTKNWSTSL